MKTSGRVNGFFLCLVILRIGGSLLVSLLDMSAVKIGTFSSLMLTQMLILVPSFVFLLFSGSEIGEWIPFKKLKVHTVGLIILFAFLIMPLITVVNVFSQLFTKNEVIEITSGFTDISSLALIFVAGLVGPFCEEFAFRGVIFGGLKKTGFVFAAAVVSGLYFGLMHLNINQMCYVLVFGVILSMLVEASGSLWSAVIVHAVINIWNLVLMLAAESFYKKLGVDSLLESQEMLTTDMKFGVLGGCILFATVTTLFSVGAFLAISRSEGRYDRVVAMFGRPEESEDADRGPVITVTGYIGIAMCLFVIFLLDKVMQYFTGFLGQ